MYACFMKIIWQLSLGVHYVPDVWVTRVNGTWLLVLQKVHGEVRSAVVPVEVSINQMTATSSRRAARCPLWERSDPGHAVLQGGPSAWSGQAPS